MPRTFGEFCAQFRDEPLLHIVKIGRRTYFDPLGLAPVAGEKRWDVFSVGLYLGEERRDFQPTSALISLLGEGHPRRVAVNDKAAWLFLCGRDILMDGALLPGSFQRGELVFVTDEVGDILGYGKIVSSFDRHFRTRTYVKHMLDRGEYLRRER